MQILTEHKATVMASAIDVLGGALSSGSADGVVTADDWLDFFAFGAAMIIDNDTHLTNPGARRKAAEVAKKHIERNMRTLAAAREESGQSFLMSILNSSPAPANDDRIGPVR